VTAVTEEQPHRITNLLQQVSRGDRQASDEVVEIVQAELRRLASRYMSGERQGHILQTTALVNEAYMRLFRSEKPLQLNDRKHFFVVAAQQMRRILVDHARSENAVKRDGVKIPLDEACHVSSERSRELVALDDALKELELVDPEASKVVELRFFGGYTDKEVSEIMERNIAKVRRDWEFARAWLYDRLEQK
jgi:RNA polymerase sigma-70 factor, ECF subfamily